MVRSRTWTLIVVLLGMSAILAGVGPSFATVGSVLPGLASGGPPSGGSPAPPQSGPSTAAPHAPNNGTQTSARSRPVRPYDSREALQANASFALPEPTIPPEFTFDSGVLISAANATRIGQAFHHRTDSQLVNILSVRKSATDLPLNTSVGNATTVDGQRARYVVAEAGRRTLIWRCQGFTYRVSVQHYSETFQKTDLFVIADSIACESA